MRPIPKKLRTTIADNKEMKFCCLAWQYDTCGPCGGTVQWHHNLIYAGRQVNEEFCILPLCEIHHRIADRKEIKILLNKIMVQRMPEEMTVKFPRVNFKLMLQQSI